MYNLDDPQNAEQSYTLNGIGDNRAASRLPIKVALGDSAVSFDFGPPVELKRKVLAD